MVNIQPLPTTKPTTQSPFFMPIISHALCLVTKRQIGPNFEGEINMVISLNRMGKDKYRHIVEQLAIYLSNNLNELQALENEYLKPGETMVSENKSGHINGKEQQNILEKVSINIDLLPEFKEFGIDDIYSIVSTIIYSHYEDLKNKHY